MFHRLAPRGGFYVTIDRKGWYYTCAEQGAYRSVDFGETWGEYVMRFADEQPYNGQPGRTNVTRGAEDYQRLALDFAGSGIAFPSDQGLLIAQQGADERNLTLINANGDLSNSITITVAVSPGDGTDAGRYLVVTVWDWNVLASWNGGKTWPATPGRCWDHCPGDDGGPGTIGEGGAAKSLGASNHVILMHHDDLYYSSRGGKNVTRVKLPYGSEAHSSMLDYTRTAGSRTEPDGFVFTVAYIANQSLPPTPTPAPPPTPRHTPSPPVGTIRNGTCGATSIQGDCNAIPKGVFPNVGSFVDCAAKVDGCASAAFVSYGSVDKSCSWFGEGECDFARLAPTAGFTSEVLKPGPGWSAPAPPQGGPRRAEGAKADDRHLQYTPFGELRDGLKELEAARTADGARYWMLRSANFGKNWTWTLLPAVLAEASVIVADPTAGPGSPLYAVCPTGIAKSTDKGETWSEFINATGLTTGVTSLAIKDSKTMIAVRGQNRVPLRTQDGGASWAPLSDPLVVKYTASSFQYSFSGSFSWSGNTFEMHGRDMTAPSRGEYAGFLIKSKDDGGSFTDETGGITTTNFGSTTWYEDDLYLTTSGEGILLKEGFDL